MARKRSTRPSAPPPAEKTEVFSIAPAPAGSSPVAETTGRMIVTFLDRAAASMDSTLERFRSQAGMPRVARTADFAAGGLDVEDLGDASGLVLDELGIAIMAGDPDQTRAMVRLQSARDANVIVEPEYLNFAFGLQLDEDVLEGDESRRPPTDAGPAASISVSLDYLRGYRAAVEQLIETLLQQRVPVGVVELAAAGAFQDTGSATWGLQATRAIESRFSGHGIRVAVLDTGFDLNHPDFAGRVVESKSFVPGQAVQDGNGHGTHCIGTACGSRSPGTATRYGVACDAEIYAGKVLSNAGSGSDGSILAGINWAVQSGCQVVSMSLGRRVQLGERPTQGYETAGKRAMEAGTLIVAAAGNDSRRPSFTYPVSSPANASSIVAVAALDASLKVAHFSNRGMNPAGGEVNLAAPGVSILSSWPMPTRLRSINGTSMATPHVAGLAALIAEESPSARGMQLYRELRRRARVLPLPRADVGNGLAEAV